MKNIKRPTKEEVVETIKHIDSAFLMQSLRGAGGEPVPAVVRTISWLENEFGIQTSRLDCLRGG